MEELRLETKMIVLPQRAFRQEADGAVLVVGEILEIVRQLGVRRLEIVLGKIARERTHRGRIERGAGLWRRPRRRLRQRRDRGAGDGPGKKRRTRRKDEAASVQT